MRKKICLIIIIILAIVMSSCSAPTKKEYSQNDLEPKTKDEVLSTNMEDLVSEEKHELRIKQAGGNYYPATEDFTSRLLDKLKDYSLEEAQTGKPESFDAVLNFKGFQDIFLNTEYGLFWFNDTQVYRIKDWSNSLWKRHILRETDGQIVYHSFEKDILARTRTSLDVEAEADEVQLYYDGDIRLKVGDEAVTVLPNISEDWIESLIASNRIENQLFMKASKKENEQLFLVGSTYSHTNKYGSTSWLSCYEYNGEAIKKIWDMNNVLGSKIKVIGYDKHTLTLEIIEQRRELKIKLTQDEIDRINEYLIFLEEVGEEFIGKEDYLFFAITPTYKFFDYNKDGNEELIANVYMRGGAPGITEILYFVYDFTEEGITLKDILPSRDNKNIN